MSFRDIQIALDTRLNIAPNPIPIAWENVTYKPTFNQEWLRPTNLSSQSTLLDLASHQQNPGVYRIDAFYPINGGSKRALDKLDEIYTFYKQALTLQVDSTVVNIRAMSISPRGIVDGAWFMASLDINYIVFDNTSFTPGGGQLMWIATPTSQTVQFNIGWITTNDSSRVVFTLPSTFNVGDYFRIAGYGLAGWKLQCPAGKSIVYGDQQTSVGGFLQSIDPHDCIELVCVVANQKFEELSSQGNITVS